jgi:hypothetical protein
MRDYDLSADSMPCDRYSGSPVAVFRKTQPDPMEHGQNNVSKDPRADLLCYLVVAELVAMARTGEWLRTDHLVESGRIWCKTNGGCCDWQERVSLGQIAADLAPRVRETFGLTREQSLAPLFVDGWMLDRESPVVCGIREVCAARLSRSG